ncbi:MAG: hypothetical protein IKP86_07280 [Anaerolineaceae bacterium]|nr:hypothetical protein [Anaerolineaceae bacterium]
MVIYRRDTIEFSYSCRSDGWHMIHEIDDDDMGYWSAAEWIIPKESLAKLFSIISEEDFLELCRKDSYTGMLDFLDSHNIKYIRKVS